MSILIITFLSGCLPSVLPFLLQRILNQNLLRWFTGLSAGLLLATALMITIPEGFEIVNIHSDSYLTVDLHLQEQNEDYHEEKDHEIDFGNDLLDLIGPGGIILLGFLSIMLVESLGVGHSIHEEHHSHEGQYGHAHLHHPIALSGIVAIGLTIHAITDGLAIGSGLKTGEFGVGLSQLIAVVFHKLPAAFSLGVFCLHELRESYIRLRKVLVYLVLFSIATPFAIYVTWLGLGSISEIWTGIILLFSAGTFIYVAIVDFLPDMHDPTIARNSLIQFVCAILLILLITFMMESYGFTHTH
jgi:zinc transporter 9